MSARQAPNSTPTTRGLVERLLAVARAGTTKAGHRAITVGSESRGYCSYDYPTGGTVCGPTCLAHQATIAAAEAWLETDAASQPRQIHMGDVA